jgi:hypothetical protein
MLRCFIIFTFFFTLTSLKTVTGQTTPHFLQDVYDNLYTASENSSIGKPILIYDQIDKKQIVTYRNGNHTGTTGELIVGHKFIELIRSFGKDSCNALAFVLGHEMGHILLKQSKHIESLGTGYASQDFKKRLKGIKDTLYTTIFELEADEFSSFYAHIAGYKTTHIGSKVLDSIYNKFNLPHNLKGYPTLEERKTIAKVTGRKMAVLNKIYDVANIAIVGGKYQMAKRLYEVLLNEGFESRDIYNNIGVALTMQAIQLDTNYQTYFLPLFLDSESKLDNIDNQRGFGESPTQLLTEALEYFDKAFNRDYPLAMVNLSIVSFLLNDFEEATYRAEKAKKLGLVQGTTMLGVIAHAKNDLKSAKTYWKEVMSSCAMANRNLNKTHPSYARFNDLNSKNELTFLDTIKVDLITPFIEQRDIAKASDTLRNILNTKSLKFYNLSIENTDYMRFQISRSDGENISLAKTIYPNLQLDPLLLGNSAEKIFISNRYRYFVIKDKIIKYFPDGSIDVYVIN